MLRQIKVNNSEHHGINIAWENSMFLSCLTGSSPECTDTSKTSDILKTKLTGLQPKELQDLS